MTARRHPFFTSARGRLLSFNLLMGVVTLLVSGVAVFGFHHASQLQEQVQRQTLNDMRGSMDLARDTANVATAAVRLSQVVGALEYKSEAERLLATQQALKHSLAQLAAAPLAQQEQARVANIIRRSNALQQSVAEMLERGQRRHLQRNALLSSLYQNQSNLRHLADLNDRGGDKAIDPRRLAEMDRLIVAAIHTVTPRSIVLQLDQLRGALPTRSADPALAFVLPDVTRELATLAPLSAQLEESDLTISWYMYHIKALVALLNEDINQYVTRVAEASEQRAAQSHRELRSISMFILLSALLALAITGCAGWYIYRNLGSNLTAISRAMSRLAQGEPNVVAQLALSFTTHGRRMYAIGGNPEAARLSGLRITRYKVAAYVIASLLAGLGGILLASRIGSSQVNAGGGYLMDAVAAAWIGFSLAGSGKPNALGTLVGAVILGVLSNGLVMLSVPYYAMDIIKGLVLAGALALTYFQRRT